MTTMHVCTFAVPPELVGLILHRPASCYTSISVNWHPTTPEIRYTCLLHPFIEKQQLRKGNSAQQSSCHASYPAYQQGGWLRLLHRLPACLPGCRCLCFFMLWSCLMVTITVTASRFRCCSTQTALSMRSQGERTFPAWTEIQVHTRDFCSRLDHSRMYQVAGQHQ